MVLVLCHVVLNYTFGIEDLIFVCSTMLLFLVQSGAFKLSREGFVLLQFAPAAGVRQYDWSRKQVDMLFSCFEVSLITKIVLCDRIINIHNTILLFLLQLCVKSFIFEWTINATC